jgi:hypothetical protein
MSPLLGPGAKNNILLTGRLSSRSVRYRRAKEDHEQKDFERGQYWCTKMTRRN